jgi:nitroreductase
MSRPAEAYFQRYREELGTQAVPPWNETLDLLLNHRSVRRFSDRPVPEGTLETLIAAASSASTSSNKQFWSVLSVEDDATRKELTRLGVNQRQIAESPMLLMWLADLSRIDRIAKAKGVTLEGIDYMESFLVAAMDATLAAQNATIAAESMGLSVCYLGVMRNYPVEVARAIKLPERCFVVFGMCVGYSDESVPTAVKPRLPQDVVLHRGHYDASRQAEAIERYEQHAREFRREQGQSDEIWTEHIMGRVRDGEALKGRDKLRQALNTLGFPLR